MGVFLLYLIIVLFIYSQLGIFTTIKWFFIWYISKIIVIHKSHRLVTDTYEQIEPTLLTDGLLHFRYESFRSHGVHWIGHLINCHFFLNLQPSSSSSYLYIIYTSNYISCLCFVLGKIPENWSSLTFSWSVTATMHVQNYMFGTMCKFIICFGHKQDCKTIESESS